MIKNKIINNNESYYNNVMVTFVMCYKIKTKKLI